MKYDAETGHHIKDESQPNRITWVHSLMKQSGQLPADWRLTQCLFGEHLLTQHPGKTVALVESEKTAVICAGIMPRFLWLATGGKSMINERLLVLKGRKIVAYPDIDGYATWIEKLAQFPDLHVTVSPILQRNATAEDIERPISISQTGSSGKSCVLLVKASSSTAGNTCWRRSILIRRKPMRWRR